MLEKDLKKQCNVLLKELKKSKFVSYNPYPTGEPGTPDKIGCVEGKCILIEYKVPGKELSPLQIIRRKEWMDAGAEVYIIHSKQELKEVLNGIKNKNVS